jgi:hypothetical protein
MKFRAMPVDGALRELYDRPEIPLVLFADGASAAPGAKVFAWRASDAYGKLTRNHYRVVSLRPLPPNERYLPLHGIHPPERTVTGGDEWRWLAPEAALRLPRAHGATATFVFRLSPDAPYDANPLRLFVNEREAGRLVATKREAALTINLPPGDATISVRAERSFRPADAVGNRDPRTVAVQLLRVSA